MTNESISGFLNSIAEAKRAFDAEPSYQSRIQQLEGNNLSLGQTIASRELRIHELKQAEETLIAKLRSVEAERDDAGFRHLEADDKVQGLLKVVHQYVEDGLKIIGAVTGIEQTMIAQSVLNATNEEITHVRDLAEERYDRIVQLEREMSLAQEQLTRPFAPSEDTSSFSGEGTDPSKPESYNDDLPRSVPRLQQGLSETLPTPSASAPTPQGLGQSETDPITAPTPNSASAPEDSSVSSAERGLTEGPSAGPFATPQGTQSETALSGTVTSTDAAPSSASPPERNRYRSTFYKGRKYYDVTNYVPLHEWLNCGGTREDYEWRPLPEANRASHQS